MIIARWVLQGFVAFIFLFAATNKLIYNKQELSLKGVTGLENFSLSTIRLIGYLEIAGVVGLLLPSLLHFYPVVSIISALCLGSIMIPATIIHIKRREKNKVTITLILFLTCLLIVYLKLTSINEKIN